jgi:hypothetical protein
MMADNKKFDSKLALKNLNAFLYHNLVLLEIVKKGDAPELLLEKYRDLGLEFWREGTRLPEK